MERLSLNPNAFVRPSATRGIMGGLALHTSELALMCESKVNMRLWVAIGFDMVFIETVGLGQNEIEIDNVADFVVYIVPPGSGDDLQGAKKGIMEIADMIVVNKFDGNFESACKKLKVDLLHSVHFQPQRYEDWIIPVLLTSAELDRNIDEVYNSIKSFQIRMANEIKKKRIDQNVNNMWTYIANITMSAYGGSAIVP